MITLVPKIKKAIGAAFGTLASALIYAQADGFTPEEIGGAVGLAVTAGIGVFWLKNAPA